MKADVLDKAKEIKERHRTLRKLKLPQRKMGNTKTILANKWQSMKEDTTTKAREIKENVTTAWEDIKH